MGACVSTKNNETNFSKLCDIFYSTRACSEKRFFNVEIPSKYEDVCDDVVSHFVMKGWIIKYIRYKTFAVTVPDKKEYHSLSRVT